MAALAGAALGLASPASAEPPSGTYTATVTDVTAAGPPPIEIGGTMIWAMTPCGADCTHLEINPPNAKGQEDLHMQGGSWANGGNSLGCTRTINAEATSATEVCKYWTIQYALTRTG